MVKWLHRNTRNPFKTMFSPAVSRISYSSLSTEMAASKARLTSTSTELLQHDVERLLLITEALWTMVKRQNGYADDALTKLVEELELQKIQAVAASDGVGAQSRPQPCPACGRINSAGRAFCIYCGKPVMVNPFRH